MKVTDELNYAENKRENFKLYPVGILSKRIFISFVEEPVQYIGLWTDNNLEFFPLRWKNQPLNSSPKIYNINWRIE